jgi:hypothetical protein
MGGGLAKTPCQFTALHPGLPEKKETRCYPIFSGAEVTVSFESLRSNPQSFFWYQDLTSMEGSHPCEVSWMLTILMSLVSCTAYPMGAPTFLAWVIVATITVTSLILTRACVWCVYFLAT